MKISATINSAHNLHQVTVDTNGASKQMHISPKPDGLGSSINGGELLLLSIATCFCNDIYREAAKRGLSIQGIRVQATGDFGGEGEPGSNFQYHTAIESTATAQEIEELIAYVNSIAEIHQTLRKGIEVRLVSL
jgi:uncharacterized OsmC-like protein